MGEGQLIEKKCHLKSVGRFSDEYLHTCALGSLGGVEGPGYAGKLSRVHVCREREA